MNKIFNCHAGISTQGEYRNFITSQIDQKQNQSDFLPKHSDAPLLCTGCGTRTELSIKVSMRFSYSDIQNATNDFSKDNLLGEGGYGHVYKGVLKDGQQIAAKVRKEESAQGFSEFHSEVYVLSFARHKNIVMLLGYCCKEKKNILIYEYICNKSLHWHLFGKYIYMYILYAYNLLCCYILWFKSQTLYFVSTEVYFFL